MGHLNWTSESIRWLSDIFEYISAENPIAVEAVVSGIYQRAQVLLSHPEIGHRYRPSKRHIRILMYGHYRIAYLIGLIQYPAYGRWEFTIHRIFGSNSEVVSDVSVTDGVQSARAISLFTVFNRKIVRLVEFWPEPYNAPNWRSHLVEHMV